MESRTITFKKLTEYILWIIAYIPVILLLILKYLKQSVFPRTFMFQLNKDINVNLLGDKLIYIFLLLITISFYKISNRVFIMKMEKKIISNRTKLYVRKHNQISINEYSFFILSLLLPFLSHNTDNELDLLLAISIILIIIGILVKKNHMIINPIFLFSKCNVFKSSIQIDNVKKEVYIITLEESLDSDYSFNYVEYFKGIYYVEKT